MMLKLASIDREGRDAGQGDRHRLSSRQAGEGVARGPLSGAWPDARQKSCINYDLHESPDALGVLVFLENWESKADLDTHRGGGPYESRYA